MVEIGPFEYLLDMLADLGFAQNDMAGERPISWAEIDAFARLTGKITPGWEPEILMAMSRAYIVGRRRGEQPSLQDMPMLDLDDEADYRRSAAQTSSA